VGPLDGTQFSEWARLLCWVLGTKLCDSVARTTDAFIFITGVKDDTTFALLTKKEISVCDSLYFFIIIYF